MELMCVVGLWLQKWTSYFHLYDGLQGLGFTGVLMELISSVQLLKEKKTKQY